MQLSPPILPFVLPAAPSAPAIPATPAAPGHAPALVVADFGSLLSAQTAPVASVGSFALPLATAGTFVEPADSFAASPPAEPMIEEGSAELPDVAPAPHASVAALPLVAQPVSPAPAAIGLPADASPENIQQTPTAAETDAGFTPPVSGERAPVAHHAPGDSPARIARGTHPIASASAPAGEKRPGGTNETPTTAPTSLAPVRPLRSEVHASVAHGDEANEILPDSIADGSAPQPSSAAGPLGERSHDGARRSPSDLGKLPVGDLPVTHDYRRSVPVSSLRAPAPMLVAPTSPTGPAPAPNEFTSPAGPLGTTVPDASRVTPESPIASQPAPSSPSFVSPVKSPAPRLTETQADDPAFPARIEIVETSRGAVLSPAAGTASLPASRPLTEKIAAYSVRATPPRAETYRAAEKNTQTTYGELVEIDESAVGTNVAKPEAPMPTLAPHASSAPHAIERLSHVVAPFAAEFDAGSEGDRSVEFAPAARRAVNAAIALTEQFAAEGKPAVTLKFTVSGVDLGVRVELRGENVHTTFRTDSPELRAALAQEWQAVAAGHAGDRLSRLVEPVFASNHPPANTQPAQPSAASNGSSFTDSGPGDQRGSQQRQDHAASEEWARFRALSRPADSTALRAAAPAVVSRSPVSAVPGRLHTFA